MSDQPSLMDELTLKAINCLENAQKKLELGAITKREFALILETAFSICSGITDREFFEAISDERNSIGHDHSFLRHILMKYGENDYVLVSRFPENKISVMSFKAASSKLIELGNEAFDKEVSDKVDDVITALTRKGFKVVV